jgi:hypothetical protein
MRHVDGVTRREGFVIDAAHNPSWIGAKTVTEVKGFWLLVTM